MIDFDEIMRNPDESSALIPGLHSGDFLPPNEMGSVVMGRAIDHTLFE